LAGIDLDAQLLERAFSPLRDAKISLDEAGNYCKTIRKGEGMSLGAAT
jgi:hypothetical protein